MQTADAVVATPADGASPLLKKIVWVAYARSLFDGIENIAIIITICVLPLGKWLLFIASVATVFKWLAMALYIFALIFIVIVAMRKKAK